MKIVLLALCFTIVASAIAFSQSTFNDEVELRIAARTLDDGQVEFAVLHNDEYVLPSSRFYTPDSEIADWAHSSPVVISDNRGLHTGEGYEGQGQGDAQGLRISLQSGRWLVRLVVDDATSDTSYFGNDDSVTIEIVDDVGNTINLRHSDYSPAGPYSYTHEINVGPWILCSYGSACVSAGELRVEVDAQDDEDWTLTIQRVVE